MRQVDPAGAIVRPNASGLNRRALERRRGSRVTRSGGKRHTCTAECIKIGGVDCRCRAVGECHPGTVHHERGSGTDRQTSRDVRRTRREGQCPSGDIQRVGVGQAVNGRIRVEDDCGVTGNVNRDIVVDTWQGIAAPVSRVAPTVSVTGADPSDRRQHLAGFQPLNPGRNERYLASFATREFVSSLKCQSLTHRLKPVEDHRKTLVS